MILCISPNFLSHREKKKGCDYMAMDLDSGNGSKNPKNIFKILKYRSVFRHEHPDYFDSDGLLCFTGAQGQGKTLSAVNYVYNLMEKYPKCKLVTNLMLRDYPIVTYEEFYSLDKGKRYLERLRDVGVVDEVLDKVLYQYYLEENRVFAFIDNDDLSRYSNDECGVIFLIDEIQLYLNSLQSNNINMEVMTQISQQRKQRKHIVCTSQVFGRMAKPLREQFSSVIQCKCILGMLQNNALIDRDSLQTESSTDTNITGEIKARFVWFHTPEMYKRYDTYYVIEKGKFATGDEKRGDIYGHDNVSANN